MTQLACRKSSDQITAELPSTCSHTHQPIHRRVVLDVFPEVPAHPRLAAAWVWLLRGGALDAQANMEVAESILDLLWRATAHQEATVRAAAHSCLSQYSESSRPHCGKSFPQGAQRIMCLHHRMPFSFRPCHEATVTTVSSGISLMQDAGCSRSGAELFRILTVETDGRVRAAMLPLIRETALFESRRRRAAAASRGVSSRYAMATAAGVPSLLRHLAVTAPMALAGARGAEGQERAGCLVATAETVDAALSEGAFQGYPMAESSWRALGTVMVYVNGLCRALEEVSGCAERQGL